MSSLTTELHDKDLIASYQLVAVKLADRIVVDDQEYTLDGSIMIFELTPLRIDPDPNISMSY